MVLVYYWLSGVSVSSSDARSGSGAPFGVGSSANANVNCHRVPMSVLSSLRASVQSVFAGFLPGHLPAQQKTRTATPYSLLRTICYSCGATPRRLGRCRTQSCAESALSVLELPGIAMKIELSRPSEVRRIYRVGCLLLGWRRWTFEACAAPTSGVEGTV